MEIAGNQEQGKKKISFEFGIVDDQINLIDILSENDEFLSASAFTFESLRDSFQGFRLSGIGNPPTVRQEGGNVLGGEFVRPSRPSFLRKSLAWDSAFFDNAGVLDPDELSFMNKGLERIPVVHDQRSKGTAQRGPLAHQNESRKAAASVQPRLHCVQEGKKFDRYVNNKMKTNQSSSAAKCATAGRKERMQKETPPSRKQAAFSPKTIAKPMSMTKSLNCLSEKPESRKGTASAAGFRFSSDSKILKQPDTRKGFFNASNMSIKPSGLRPPSPRHRFFDEATPVGPNATTRPCMKRTPDVRSSDSNTRIKGSSVDHFAFLKRSKTIGSSYTSLATTEKQNSLKRTGANDQNKYPRKKHIRNPNSKEETTKGVADNQSIADLSKQFLVMDLNKKVLTSVQSVVNPKGKTFAAGGTRRPLSDKTSKFNSRTTTTLDQPKLGRINW